MKGKRARDRAAARHAAPREPVPARRGLPRDLAGLSDGNPFADDTRQRTGYDDTFSGFTDMRRHVAPTYEMGVPHRVTAWPDTTPSVSARAASYGR
jgi:hypothetical protein